MEKIEFISGENRVFVDSGFSGVGTVSEPLSYTGTYQHTDKRVLLWSATGNPYNTNIT